MLNLFQHLSDLHILVSSWPDGTFFTKNKFSERVVNQVQDDLVNVLFLLKLQIIKIFSSKGLQPLVTQTSTVITA